MVYKTIISSIEGEKGDLFSLYAPGGTGKTFLINLLLAKLCQIEHIAPEVALSGIVATLLSGLQISLEDAAELMLLI